MTRDSVTIPVVDDPSHHGLDVDGGTPSAGGSRIRVRRGHSAVWANANPFLADGETGRETDTGRTKTGPGRWNDLSYERTSVIEPVTEISASGSALTVPAPSVAALTRVTLTAACTVTMPTPQAGASLTLVLTQDSTGSRTVTWPASVRWPGGTAPTLSTAAGAVDWLTFASVDGTTWAGFRAGLDVR